VAIIGHQPLASAAAYSASFDLILVEHTGRDPVPEVQAA
jgi:hypothetical protein